MSARIANFAEPGELLVKHPRQHNAKHLAAIRECPCIVCGVDPAGEAAHVRFACAESDKPISGIGNKPDDQWTVPLCHPCHMLQHSEGERSFWVKVGINPLRVCERLIRVSPDVRYMRAIVKGFIDVARS